MVRVLECQAEVYEYLAGSRGSAPVKEYMELIDVINKGLLAARASAASARVVFDSGPGEAALARIDALLEPESEL